MNLLESNLVVHVAILFGNFCHIFEFASPIMPENHSSVYTYYVHYPKIRLSFVDPWGLSIL